MVVGFTATNAISVYHHQNCEWIPLMARCTWYILCDRVCQSLEVTCSRSVVSSTFNQTNFTPILLNLLLHVSIFIDSEYVSHMVGSFNPFENKENKKHNVSQYISTISFQSFFKDILLYFLKIQKLIYLYFHGPCIQYS